LPSFEPRCFVAGFPEEPPGFVDRPFSELDRDGVVTPGDARTLLDGACGSEQLGAATCVIGGNSDSGDPFKGPGRELPKAVRVRDRKTFAETICGMHQVVLREVDHPQVDQTVCDVKRQVVSSVELQSLLE
jgi:hypothetical protein